jgi:hypothetical protein
VRVICWHTCVVVVAVITLITVRVVAVIVTVLSKVTKVVVVVAVVVRIFVNLKYKCIQNSSVLATRTDCTYPVLLSRHFTTCCSVHTRSYYSLIPFSVVQSFSKNGWLLI